MYVIHKTWCGACKQLRPKFAESTEIEELSKKFVMVNLQDEEEPSDSSYAPDGGYIPRIVFADSEGTVKEELINEKGNPKYKYYYSDAASIVESMRGALKKLSAGDL